MLSHRFGAALAACIWAIVWPWSGASGQTVQPQDTVVLTLSSALRLAADGNPDLQAASWRPEAAQGDLFTARTLAFNPDLAFESRAPGDGLGSRYEAALGLEVEFAGQRGLRGNASEAAWSASQQIYQDEGRLILAQVARTFVSLVAAEERVRLAEETWLLNDQLQDAVTEQLSEGQISVLEANLVAIEAARAEARTLAVSSQRTTVALEIGRLLGLDAAKTVRTSGPREATTPLDSSYERSLEVAMAARPDLLAGEYSIESARQEERLSRRESWPNLRLAGLATKEDPLADPRFGVSIGLELPLFNRGQGRTYRRQAEIRIVEDQRRATALRVRTEVEDAVRAYTSARQEVELLESRLLEPIRQNHELLDIAYREGKIDLATVLLLRNQLLDAELSYWDAWERQARARADLSSATGEILRGVSLPNRSDR